jgi:hypothetical protein
MSKEKVICPTCTADATNLPPEHLLKIQQLTQVAGLVDEIFNFLASTMENHSPQMTQLCSVHNEGNPETLMYLWAGFGKDNPISRLFVKNDEIAALTAKLEKATAALKHLVRIAVEVEQYDASEMSLLSFFRQLKDEAADVLKEIE